MKSIKILKSSVLATILLFAEFYVIKPNYRVTTISIIVLVFAYYFFGDRFARTNYQKVFLKSDTRSVLKAASIFLLYMFTVNVFRDENLLESAIDGLVGLCFILILPIYEERTDDYKLIRGYKRYMIIVIAFMVVQFVWPRITIGSLLPNLGLIQAYNAWDNIESEVYYRLCGPTGNIIFLSQSILVFVALTYCRLLKKFRPVNVILFVIMVFLLFGTQVRSTIFGLIPAIVFSLLFFEEANKGSILRLGFIACTLLVIYIVVLYGMAGDLDHLNKDIDTGDTHRFDVNYQMSIGILNESPIFGIPPSKAWDVYLKYCDSSLGKYNPDQTTPTHHNQVAFYLRYYGIVGVALLLWLYVAVYRKILHAHSSYIKIFLFIVITTDLISSLAHNNKLLSSPLLWILLSLASIDPKEEVDIV